MSSVWGEGSNVAFAVLDLGFVRLRSAHQMTAGGYPSVRLRTGLGRDKQEKFGILEAGRAK
jgi:hypothetical protein